MSEFYEFLRKTMEDREERGFSAIVDVTESTSGDYTFLNVKMKGGQEFLYNGSLLDYFMDDVPW